MDTPVSDELLGTICHDLKEPLASIVMGSSFLMRELPHEAGADRARRMVEAIHRAAHRMNRLLSDYHELSRFERGIAALDVADHDAAVLLAEAIEPFREAAHAAGITITLVDDKQLKVRCDRERLVDAIGKLVSNALRATPRGGSISLVADAVGATIEIAVADTGNGVAPDLLPHLFDYRWLATRRSRSGPGLGLGLARRIVEAHGGELRVDSTPGRGAVFTMALPTEFAHAP